jgi:virginiamycin A acetyltransferase
MIGRDRFADNARLWRLRRRGNTMRMFAGVDIDAATVLEAPVRVGPYTRVTESQIGSYTYFGNGCTLLGVNVGRFCSGAWGVTLGASGHHLDCATTHTFPWLPVDGGFVAEPGMSVSPLHVGHDVWLGCNAVVLSGLTVGHGAAVAAGAIVVHDVPDYAVVAGVPARVVRLRFDESLVERLLTVGWWNWPITVLRENLALFQEPLNAEVMDALERVAESLSSAKRMSADEATEPVDPTPR